MSFHTLTRTAFFAAVLFATLKGTNAVENKFFNFKPFVPQATTRLDINLDNFDMIYEIEFA